MLNILKEFIINYLSICQGVKFLKKNLAIIALFAALTAVLSQIVIPIGPVPINLALISVFVAGGLLGWKSGAVSQIIFVLLGGLGLPIFAGFNGGIGAILGPTGGFIIGYIPCVMLIGCIKQRWLGMLLGLAVVYIMGISWYIYITGSSLAVAIMICVAPFLVGDFVKIVISLLAIKRLRRIYNGN